MYRALSSRYGWTPKEISQMTLTQMLMYLEGDGDDRFVKVGTMAEARALINELEAEKE